MKKRTFILIVASVYTWQRPDEVGLCAVLYVTQPVYFLGMRRDMKEMMLLELSLAV